MIRSFANASTEHIFDGLDSRAARQLPRILWPVIRRKLDMVNAAFALQDLRVPPGNRLEALRGDYEGYFSIRVNDQYRVVFRFEQGDAYDVACVDYH